MIIKNSIMLGLHLNKCVSGNVLVIRYREKKKKLAYSPGKVGFYPPLIAKETKPTALRALVYI